VLKPAAQVRELDRAQTRVTETLKRIDAIVERSSALAGASSALEAEDFERAAACVARYLALDSKYPGLTPEAEEGGGAAAHEALLATKSRLEEAVRARFAAALAGRAHGEVLRFAALFPLLGCGGEGATALVGYLRGTVAARARAEAEALSDALHAGAGAPKAGAEAPSFAGALSGLFKDVALALEEHEALLRASFGAEALARAASELHAEVDVRGSALLRRFAEHHQLARLVAACPRRGGGGGSGEPPPDPRTVELHLEEALLLCARAEEYTAFLLAKLRAAGAPPPALAALRSGAFGRALLELVALYIRLEEFFMVENVQKAIRIDEHAAGQLTSSLVDDVFYILLKCGRRSGAAGSVQCTCAVFNHVSSLLQGEVREALSAQLRGAPARLLAAAAPGGAGGAPLAAAAACLNNVDVAAEYVLKLRAQLEEHALGLYDGAGDRDKIRTCLADLGEAAAAYRRQAAAAAEELAAGVAPRLRPLVDAAGSARYELSEAEYGAAEADAEGSWALRLLAGAEAALAPLQPLLSAGVFDTLVQAVLDGVVQRLEAVLWQRRFNALGALALDRDLRTLLGGLSGLAPRTVRDKFARLSQIASCVGLEAPAEILDFWGENAGALTWRLTPAEVRRALGLRSEFKQEAILRLKLA